MFSCVRFGPYTGQQSDGKPDVTQFYKFITSVDIENELTNIDITLSTEKATKTKRADNRIKRDEVITGFNGTINAYGIDFTALAAITNSYVKDSDGNLDIVAPANGNPKGVLFYHGRTGDGEKYNMWLYNVEFESPDLPAQQEGEEPQTISLNFFATKIKWGTKTVIGRLVKEGTTGYIEEGVEPTVAGIPAPVATSGI